MNNENPASAPASSLLPEDDEILRELKDRLSKDAHFTSPSPSPSSSASASASNMGNQGIMGSMCTAPDPLAARVFRETLEKNSGDPGLFPGTAELEKEILSLLGRWTGHPSPQDATGSLTSGGTEANILALWAAREQASPGADEIILPDTAHFSFDKAAALLGLRLIRIPADDNHRCPPHLVRRAITPRTAALVAVAGTTGLGAVDPIGSLAALASEHSLYLHVDAAFGGFVLPFLPGIEARLRPPTETLPPGLYAADSADPEPPPGYFAFAHPAVCSLTLDPHKMGRAPIPAGAILFRNPSHARATASRVPYLAGGLTKQQTLTGTRPGASVCAVWTALRRHGWTGYQNTVRIALEKTAAALQAAAETKLQPVIPPPMNVLGLHSPRLPASELASRLRIRGWHVSLFPNFIRIVLMPHVTMGMIHDFFTDTREVLHQ